MSKFEILHRFVRRATTSLRLYIYSVREQNTKHKIFYSVIWICLIIVVLMNLQ